MNNFLNLFLKGIFIGIANIIPGVSGGTIAVVLRVFDQLIDAINNFFKTPKKHFKFILFLGLGAAFGIIIFSKLISFLLYTYSFPTSMFFVGLVVGSVPLIYSNVKKKSGSNLFYYFVSIFFFFLIVFISFIKEPTTTNVLTSINYKNLTKIFLGSIIASSAMVIPGISGSFVMVLLGLYNTIISSISGFVDVLILNLKNIFNGDNILVSLKQIFTSNYFIILLVAIIGVFLGIIIISKLISFLLKNAFNITYFSILGLIFGSIFSIFKDPITYQSHTNGLSLNIMLVSVFTFFIGFFIALKLGKNK